MIQYSLRDPYICGSPTCSLSEKFKYLQDVNYHYKYKTNVETYFAGSSNNRSTLDIQADVKIQFITPCEGLLALSDVTLTDQDQNYPAERADRFFHAVSQYDLRFAFHDGIVSEICPEQLEEEWVLNFKRAILSLFQNSMKRFDIDFKGVEQDIHGSCSVQYTVRGQKTTSLVLVKTRDLAQCTDRFQYMSILQTVRYDFQSKFQTWPVLKSESKCVVTVDHHIYKAVQCRERHLFEPFSGRNSGAMTTVIQDLVLIREDNKTNNEVVQSQPKAWSEITKRSNLLHHHTTYGNTGSIAELKSARDVLKLLCQIRESGNENNATVEEKLDSGSTVGLWGRLVRAARGLHHAALAQLLARAPAICDTATKHLMDALPYIASAGSVELIKDMITNNSVDSDTRHEWLMSMAMIPRPNIAMLGSMLELLGGQPRDKVVSFTVSSMLHSYCKHSGKSLRECCEEEVPRRILEVFQGIVDEIVVKDLANLSRDEREKLVIAMKAMGNIGGFSRRAADALTLVVGDAAAPVPVRLAAVDAFRRTPCGETREYFLETYRAVSVAVEVRLAAYLQVMRCPDLPTVRKLVHQLRHEPVNQAKTFVWSHLHNVAQSSLPSRVEIQSLLSGNPPPRLDDRPDFRMYSRNYERSVFFDQYNAGGNYEANVVFSPDSYIPRSVSLNLTVDMFGESINLLELKGRVEGFERYFEQLFGDGGPLSKTKLNDVISGVRFLRSLNNADEVRRKIDQLGFESEALKHQLPVAELVVKVFGNEISFWNAEGHDEIAQALARLNPKLRILEILSGKEISYNKASLFVDTTFSVATGCGLPLAMNLMGTSYVNTNMSGAFTREANSPTLLFEGKIRPSVAVNIAATMTVSAGGLSASGVRLTARLYTATALGARLRADGLTALRLHLSLPTDKQEIFAAKSELVVLHGDTELQQQGLNKNRIEQNTCSWSAFDRAIGIKVCAAYQFPNMTNLPHAPYFLLSGPAKYVVSLEKADPSAKTYVLDYKWVKNATADVISFAFDTPNSLEKRKFDAVLSVSNASSTALVSFQSSRTSMHARALYRNLDGDKSVEASIEVDGRKQFEAVVAMRRQPIPHGHVWLPRAYLVVDDARVAELAGSIKAKSKGGVVQWDITVDFQTKQLASRLIGYYTINGPTHGTKLQLDYEFHRNPKQAIKLEGVYSERVMGYRHDLFGDVSMEFTAYPAYNFYAVLRYVRVQGHVDVGFNVSASRALVGTPALAFGYSRVDKLSGLTLDTHLLLTKPWPVKVIYHFEEIGPKYTVSALLNFSPRSRDIAVSGYLYAPPGSQLYADAQLNATLPSLHPCTLRAKLHEKRPNHYQVNLAGVWFTGVDFNVDALYEDTSRTNLASHHLKLLVSGAQFPDVAVDARFTQDNRQITFVGSGQYNEHEYRALLRHVLHSAKNFSTYVELDAGRETYSINLAADLNNNTNINVDIHFDEQRDIQITFSRWWGEQARRVRAAVHWDANRDPEQKVALDAQLERRAAWHHAGRAALYYPGRMISTDFEFLLRDWFCEWHLMMSWSNAANILWRVKMYSEARQETVYALLSTMTTPFAGLEDTSFNVMWRYHDNLQALNGSMSWQRERLSVGLLADYSLRSDEFYGRLTAEVNSTRPALPSAAAAATHRVLWGRSADTLLSFQYNNEGLLMINSSWLLEPGEKEHNVTGRVTLLSPFKGYRRGALSTRFVLGHKRDISGVTHFDLEDKILDIYVDGHLRRITNCMVRVNATSPALPRPLVAARFGLVEADRHLVAMVVTPNSTTGIEVLLKLKSVQDFNVYGHIALPIQYLNRAKITAKRAFEEVDLRVGWGDMDLGFTGIWHWRSLSNFVYLYKLYTPLEGFEENGLVLKNVYGNGLDTEVSMQLSKHKFGVAIQLEDKGKGLLVVVSERLQRPRALELIGDFDTTASVVLDTLYYPTVTFRAHLMKYEDSTGVNIVEANATLHLPDMPPVVLADTFVMEDLLTVRNTLSLVTPFQAMQEVKSVWTMQVIYPEFVNATFVALLYNGTYWHEISSKLFYELSTGEDDAYNAHAASLAVRTPLPVLPALEAAVTVRIEDKLWKMTAGIQMPSFNITAIGRLELDDPFVETSGSLNLTSPHLEDYHIRMEFKKDVSSDQEYTMGGGVHVTQGGHVNYMYAEGAMGPALWRVSSRFELWPAVPATRLALRYEWRPPGAALSAELAAPGRDYSLLASATDRSLLLDVATPHRGYRSVRADCTAEPLDATNYTVRGQLATDHRQYDVTGQLHRAADVQVSLELVPRGGGESIVVRGRYSAAQAQRAVQASASGALRAELQASVQCAGNGDAGDAGYPYCDIDVEVSAPQYRARPARLAYRLQRRGGERRALRLRTDAPLPALRNLTADADFQFGPKTGYLLCNYGLSNLTGDGNLTWSFFEGDMFIRALGHQLIEQAQRSVDLDIYFGNTTQDGLGKTNAGFRMDLDRIWLIGANSSFGYNLRQLHLVINAILPRPSVDVHTLRLDVHTDKQLYRVLNAEYTTDVTKIVTGLKGRMLLSNDSFIGNASALWTSNGQYKAIDNRLLYRWHTNVSYHLDYGLVSPLYAGEDTFNVNGSYTKDAAENYHIVNGVMHRPGGRRLGELALRYGGVRHTRGHFNCSTPFGRLPWLRAVFHISNSEEQSDNKVDLYWPLKYASLNTTHRYTKRADGFTQIGDVSLLIPLSASHLVTTNYYYVQGDKTSNGNATLDLDHVRFVKGSFDQIVGSSERGLDLSTSDIRVENDYAPVGVKYIHEYDDTGDVDAKQATVFHLTNATKFNVTGKLDVATRATGKDVRLIAVHGNRTLTIDNRYEAAGNELEQGSKITWSEDVWFHYHIRVTNMSTEDTERQRAAVEVRYPRRSYGAAAQYELRDALLAARLRLRWDTRGENKTAELRARWDGPPHAGGARHRLALALHHPSFRKNVTLDGEYLSTPSVMSNVSLELQYSDDDSEYLKLRSLVVDNSDGPIRDYKFGLTCTHPSTNLDLEIASEVRIHHRWYYFNDYYRYKKTLFTEKLKHNKLVVDLNNNTIQVESTNDTSFYKLNGSWSVPYGRWGARATVLRPTGNDSASAALSLRDRRLVAHYNSTDDVSYHLLGVIPDARSARLDAWRDYGDVTTVDLASYVRLNHSRLLTSSVVWRPQVFGEIKARAVYTLKRLYDQINGTLTVIKDAPMEANRTLKNIWLDAEPQLRDFISDLNDLHVIKDDLDEFKVFINESYESNDFYVKDIVEFTYYVLDEMAIRNHLESLPGIVNDMWGMMGNTSQSIKQSLTFVADKVKMAYSDFLVSVDRFLEADFMQIVSNKLESMILQYDNFVRDLHMKLLEYWEATWVNATNRLYQYWHDILKSIEPLFFKIVHYTESVVFTLGKGVLDFFYDRTQELTDSPYFNYVATFGHEMDKIYKDLTHNDLITNVKKYSRKVWSAVWTKVERYLPFKDEVAQLRAEFAAAWDAFRRSAQVVYVTDKCQEAYIRLKWWYDYFLIGEALDRVGEILYAKLTDMAKTALQYEELHRTPKTNFIFDPRKGEILLEQKLPMSWHAFNRTPELAEVAEYRAARQLLDDWLAGDRSLWSLYYEVRPYMDVDNVLPPFAGLAMMTGQGTLVTFDKRVLTLSRPGTFLLARDYRCDNFTVLMASSGGRRGAYDLVVLTRTQLIRIDLYREQVSLGGDAPLTLPALVDGWLVARQADSVTVGGPGGLRIDCSLLFRTCKIEVAGWYYATLGGLLGTYNNEQFDELRLPNNSLARDDAALARSWNIEPEALLAAPLAAPLAEHDHEPENDTQCEKFFLNKVSPLHPCFSVIEASPFHSWCARGVSACSLASAYMQLCEHQHVPTRMPDHCLQCTTPSGEVVEEGAFHELRAAPRSTDVVFVMEAQRCNRGVRKARHADLLVEALDSKLQGAGLSDNRYAIVGFGGSGVYREPRALYVNNRVFTDAVGVAHHFDNFYVESEDASPRARNRSSGGGGDDRPPVDMLRALRFATRLVVRAGVPRTLVLLPCARTRSRCDPATSTLDYSTIYHNLMESSVTLHILMDDDFMLSKRRAAKYLFGVDSNLAYTNKDYERLVGDAGLRKQVKLPKEKLGLCTSLAMETNGTIFAGRKLQGERAAARRFATVFGARAAAAAGAARGAAACARAARCECRDARLHCAPCADTQRMMELSFWNSEDIDELMDASLEAPALP